MGHSDGDVDLWVGIPRECESPSSSVRKNSVWPYSRSSSSETPYPRLFKRSPVSWISFGCPVESNALVAFRHDRSPRTLVQHEIQVSFRSMQKISRSALRISELIENPRPSTRKRRLFSRSARGITGMQDSIGMTVPFAKLHGRACGPASFLGIPLTEGAPPCVLGKSWPHGPVDPSHEMLESKSWASPTLFAKSAKGWGTRLSPHSPHTRKVRIGTTDPDLDAETTASLLADDAGIVLG